MSAAVMNFPSGRGCPPGSLNKATVAKYGIEEQKVPIEPEKPETEAQISSRITKTFNVMNRITDGVIENRVRAAIISGATGCGKTYEVERKLDYAAAQGVINYKPHSGACSAPGLYRLLHECSTPGAILTLDDCDTVYYDMDALNLLKKALDTSKTRRISWNKESNFLEKWGLPNEFEFEGACILISNINFSNEIKRGTKIAPHLSALLGRTMYIHLGIHSRREILVRIKQVMGNSYFFLDNKLTPKEGLTIIDWLEDNFAKVRTLSIRTAVQLGQLMQTDPEGWRDTAEIVLCER